jgi:hypothetical protein
VSWAKDSFDSLGAGAATAGQDYPIDPNRKANTEIFTDLCSGMWTSCGVLSNGTSPAPPPKTNMTTCVSDVCGDVRVLWSRFRCMLGQQYVTPLAWQTHLCCC